MKVKFNKFGQGHITLSAAGLVEQPGEPVSEVPPAPPLSTPEEAFLDPEHNFDVDEKQIAELFAAGERWTRMQTQCWLLVSAWETLQHAGVTQQPRFRRGPLCSLCLPQLPSPCSFTL